MRGMALMKKIPTFDDLVFLPGTLTRFVIEGYREKCAKKTGDIHSLSEQDISCIALSLELDAELISDDFAVSNVSNALGLKTIPLMTNGIKVIGKWIFYCPACKKDFSNEKNCLLCGNKLKKKLVKKKS